MRVKLGYGVVDDIEVIQAAQAHGIEVNPAHRDFKRSLEA